MELATHANSQGDAGTVAFLQLLHLADSALPIGATAHSFGVETLIAESGLGAAELPSFFEDWLQGQGHTEATFCLRAYDTKDEGGWHLLNAQISSFKPARESRDASLRLGKRFLALAEGLVDAPGSPALSHGEAHLAAAFGKIGAMLRIDSGMVAAAYLHQSIFGSISACQRLLPLGQTAAMRILWLLKPAIQNAVKRAQDASLEELWNIQPLLEVASMRHPKLTTRLFIS